MYDWRGRWIEQDDDDPPRLRRHCVCGSFLPVKPQEVEREDPKDWEYTYDEEGNITGRIVHSVLKYTDRVWTCKKCQRAFGTDEMYE